MIERVRPKPVRKSSLSSLDDSFPIPSIDKILIDPVDLAELEEYEEGLGVDPDGLDEALMNQPVLFYEVSKKLALLISRRDAAKQHLSNVEARVDGMIRRAAREKEVKRTEDEVKSTKRMHADVVKASNQLLRLSHSVNTYEALKEAFKQRSYAVNKLIDLYTANYFGDANHKTSKANMDEVKADKVRRELNARRRGIENGK